MANLYDLKKFDLNLLVIFECIYQHLSISKAAETLYITPSAVSQSLQRLRNQLEDPLFIRSGKGITPTTLGINLHYHLEQNLNQLEQTINIMHGTQLKKNFIIYCPQLLTPGRLLAPIKMLFTENNYEVEQYDMLVSASTAEDLLAYRKADLIMTFAPVNNRSMVCTRYHKYPIVLVCRKDHPRLSDRPTVEELLNERFTIFQSEEAGIKAFRARSDTFLPDRQIAFRSDSLISIVSMLSASDLVGYLPQPVFEMYHEMMNLKTVELPFVMNPVDIYMVYNRSALNSVIFSQFVEKITSV